MPIHELGYRPWLGTRRPRLWRWWSITRTGVAIAYRNTLTRRLVMFALFPLAYFGPLFFVIGMVTDPEAIQGQDHPATGMATWALGVENMLRLRAEPDLMRERVWNDIFHLCMSSPQLWIALVMSLFVAPPLISRDVGSRAFLLYFAKPIGRTDYVLGKFGVLSGYLAYVTLLPALLAYVLSIAFSPSIDTVRQTAPVAVAIVAAAAIITIPLTAAALAVSSLFANERVAAFAWIATVLGGEMAYGTLSNLEGFHDAAWPTLLSLRASIAAALNLPFSTPILPTLVASPHATIALQWLIGITVLSLCVLWRRISAPMRI